VTSATPFASPTNAALRLGYAGLMPFVSGAALSVLMPEWRLAAASTLSAYAAVITSFLGGIHWGFAMRQNGPASLLPLWGVVPSLVAWAAVLMPLNIGLFVHAAMLITCYAVDRRVYPAQGAGAWLPMRLRLTTVAAISCIIGALAS
jgi:putative flippase GtrA